MPYKSQAQVAKFHELLKQGKISQAVVDEFDSASRGLKLPERISPPSTYTPKRKYTTRKKTNGV